MNKDCYNKTPDGHRNQTRRYYRWQNDSAILRCDTCAEGKTGCDTDEHVLCALCEKPMCLLHSHHEMWDGEQVCAECIAIPEEE